MKPNILLLLSLLISMGLFSQNSCTSEKFDELYQKKQELDSAFDQTGFKLYTVRRIYTKTTDVSSPNQITRERRVQETVMPELHQDPEYIALKQERDSLGKKVVEVLDSISENITTSIEAIFILENISGRLDSATDRRITTAIKSSKAYSDAILVATNEVTFLKVTDTVEKHKTLRTPRGVNSFWEKDSAYSEVRTRYMLKAIRPISMYTWDEAWLIMNYARDFENKRHWFITNEAGQAEFRKRINDTEGCPLREELATNSGYIAGFETFIGM